MIINGKNKKWNFRTVKIAIFLECVDKIIILIKQVVFFLIFLNQITQFENNTNKLRLNNFEKI